MTNHREQLAAALLNLDALMRTSVRETIGEDGVGEPTICAQAAALLRADGARIDAALEVLMSLGQVDGEHHKAWVIDQVARELLGDEYEATIDEWCSGDDGPETYVWDEGVAP